MEHIPYESYDTTDPESMSDLIEALQKQDEILTILAMWKHEIERDGGSRKE